MFQTKIEVDRHVENCQRKINNEEERKLRCIAYAKLYFKVEDFEQARRYATAYLTIKPQSAEGQCLLGKALEKLGKYDAALEAYKTSLRLDPKQNNVIIKVCEMLASQDMEIDQSLAHYYCDRAQTIDPTNPVIFRLKEQLVKKENNDPNEVTKLLTKELEARPLAVEIRVRLLRHLLQNNKFQEAYNHAYNIEQKHLSVFLNNPTWYETVAEVLVRVQLESSFSGLTWEYWMLFTSVLDKLAMFSLDERNGSYKSTTDSSTVIFNFDQNLNLAIDDICICPEKQLIQEFYSHFRGQICLHLATLLYKQARKDMIKYKEVTQLCLPLLFAAYNTPALDLNAVWLRHTTEQIRQMAQRWHREASFRCSQAGHLLTSMAKESKATLIEKGTQLASGLWREHVFRRLFVTHEHQSKIKNSYFATCNELIDVTIRLPDPTDLLKYDETAQLVYPDSLHHYIWIGMQNKLSQLKFSGFEGMQYSVKSLNNCAVESLNILDVQSFVYCATICAEIQAERNRNCISFNTETPTVLPVAVTSQFGTKNQAQWFESAYKMFKNNHLFSDAANTRLVLIQGIEVVRCVGNHGLDVKLLVKLAKIFTERAQHLTKQSEIDSNNARAELYWKAAIPLLEKLRNHQAISYRPNRMFTYKGREMTQHEINRAVEDAKLFIGTQFMKKKDYESALCYFETLTDPFASYHQSHIYKTKAEQELNRNRDNITEEMRSQYMTLLTKARDCVYLTLDRLRDPSVDRKHPLNDVLGGEIEKIEVALSRAEPDLTGNFNRNECDGMSDENASSVDSDNYYHSAYHSTFISRCDATNNHHSTPLKPNHDTSRRYARPSPERLDAQLRQLVASKDATMNHLLDQNKVIIDSHKALVEELKGCKDSLSSLATVVNDLGAIQHIKKSVEELKVVVDDLQSLRNLTDVVSEMKKEITELKKDTTKIRSNQINDEDLYALDEDYGNDYANINSNVANLTPSFYPNLGRMPPAAAAAGNALAYASPLAYPGMYPHMYPYGGLGQLPFIDPQLAADFRAMNPLAAAQSAAALASPFGPGILPSQAAAAAQQNLLAAGQSQFSQLTQATQPANLFRDVAVPSTSYTPSTSATTQSYQLPDSLMHAMSSKAAPVNVVITASDPLPKTTTTTSQILSVTIPPQHLKGNSSHAHNYQIPLPANPVVTSTPSVLNQNPPAITTQSLFSNVAPPIYSALNDKQNKETILGQQIEKSLTQSFGAASSENTSRDISNISDCSEEPEALADFKPIIPLPDEVPLNTGEENEIVLFSERSKLYRYVDKEWKERGVGALKLLQHKETNKIRLLMRRDQVHKICANHYLTDEMTLIAKDDKSYMWGANDFAEEKSRVEKLCARFKTPELAQKFYDAFEKAKKQTATKVALKVSTPILSTPKTSTPVIQTSTTLGGFTFTTTPTFKPKEDVKDVKTTKSSAETTSPNPFASFSFVKATNVPTTSSPIAKPIFTFGKPTMFTAPPTTISISTTPISSSKESMSTPKSVLQAPVAGEHDQSGDAEDFVPTVEFKPVVPLPALVEVKTGEEDAEIVFEHRAKLLRFDKATKEWKERGVGQMKILKESTVRLLMRREQVHKICCNHQLLKKMEFSKMNKPHTAVSWCAKDFSEGYMTTEMFAIKFKNVETTDAFLKAISDMQALLDTNNVYKARVSVIRLPFDEELGFGDKFKLKEGIWECKECYTRNDASTTTCVSCSALKEGTASQKKEVPTVKSMVNLDTGGMKFNFGMPLATSTSDLSLSKSTPKSTSETSILKSVLTSTSTSATTTPTSVTKALPATGFGDLFKPKHGTWECKHCYTRNDGNHCVACNSSKDGTVKEQAVETSKTSKSTLTFAFGTGPPKTEKTATFTFGTSVKPVDNKGLGFSFSLPVKNEPQAPDTTSEKTEEIVFGSPHKPGFEFTPRSPRRQSGGQVNEEDSENSYYEEEEDNIYFKPVIPLPDKVDITTGEEGENVLYCQRAKLYRYIQSEWKERGVGDIKILFKSEAKKARVLMRREQVHKICLNHWLTVDVKYSPKDDKCWLFSAADFSEGEINYQQFCIRFKTPEVALEFKKAVDDALRKITEINDDSDVEFISESKVTPDEEKEALSLKLPPKFMSYRQLPDCKCKQCEEDDEYLKSWLDKHSDSPKPKPMTGIFSTPNLSKLNTQSLFGSPKSTTDNNQTIFSTPKANISIFGGGGGTEQKKEVDGFAKPAFGQSIFGGGTLATSTQAIKPSLFGSSSTTTFKTTEQPNKSLFAGLTFGAGNAGKLLGDASASTNVFSTPKTQSGAVFSIANTTGNIFSTPTGSLFSSPSTGSIFGGGTAAVTKPTTGNIFGMNAASTPATAAPPFDGLASKSEAVFGTQSNVSFASLAAKTGDVPNFVTKSDDKNPFASLGAGAPVFASSQRASTKKSEAEPVSSSKDSTSAAEAVDEADGGGGDADTSGNEAYDPHYEAIVPLPDLVEVKTGEEDEMVLFNERAKVYRYADNEWKERGIGQLKVLHHPVHSTYRLLLRREQIHKIVLNQRITPDLDLKPMTLSANAYMWFGQNFCDNEMHAEKLAARFKLETTSSAFYACIQDVLEKVKLVQELQNTLDETEMPSIEQLLIPATVEAYEHEEVVEADNDDDEEYQFREDDDDEEVYDEEEDDRTIMFSKECSAAELLPTGEWREIGSGCEMQIFYDPEIYVSKINISDSYGCIISNTLIGANTIMERKPDETGNQCQWKSVEWVQNPMDFRTLRVTFSSAEESEECFLAYQESVGFAEQCDALDTLPQNQDYED